MTDNRTSNNETKKYKLSIITICKNEPNVEKTCQSIVNQSFQDFEWIVIDGGSNKETQDIFEKYKYRINKFISEKDKGIYNAYNKGVKLASGEYISLLNAGDAYYSPDVLEKVFKDNNHKEDILYGEQQEVNSNNPKQCRLSHQPEKITKNFMITTTVLTPASFIKKSLFDKYGLFNENYKVVSDYEQFVIFFKNDASFKHLDIIVSKFDTNGISSSKKYEELHQKERNEVMNKYFSQEEIKQALDDYKDFSLAENIFSMTKTRGKTYKVLTILGLHLRICKINKDK